MQKKFENIIKQFIKKLDILLKKQKQKFIENFKIKYVILK